MLFCAVKQSQSCGRSGELRSGELRSGELRSGDMQLRIRSAGRSSALWDMGPASRCYEEL